jgi:hypothetical protein
MNYYSVETVSVALPDNHGNMLAWVGLTVVPPTVNPSAGWGGPYSGTPGRVLGHICHGLVCAWEPRVQGSPCTTLLVVWCRLYHCRTSLITGAILEGVLMVQASELQGRPSICTLEPLSAQYCQCCLRGRLLICP